MNDILIILSLASLAWVIAGLSDLEHIRPQIKPFNCPLCMGLWLSLLTLPFIYGIDVKILYAPLVAVLANEIDKLNP
jgi:hypothetical protein